MSSISQTDGALRVVFATIFLGMGVDFKSLHYIIHYGAPRSVEDYIQESGIASRAPPHCHIISSIFTTHPSYTIHTHTSPRTAQGHKIEKMPM